MSLQSRSSNEHVSQLKEFVNWVLDIGNETIGEIHDKENAIDIPSYMLIENSGDPMSTIVNSTYPSLFGEWGTHFFHHKAILAPTNDVINDLNEHIMALIPG